VSAALLLLASLIGAAPEILVIDETVVNGLILAIVAIGIAIVALSMRPGDAGRLIELLRPVVIFALIPAVWMLIQIAPLSMVGWAHPVWTSAAAALERSIAGTISIDTGATLLSISRYFCFAGIVLLSTAVSIDRERAGLLLMLLTGVTTLIAAELIIYHLGYFGSFFGEFGDTVKHGEALDCAALGLILSASLGVRALERQERRRTDARRTPARLALALVAFAISLGAVLLNWDRILLFGIAYGLGTLISVAAIRRLRIGRWGKLELVSLAILGAAGFIATTPGIQDLGLTLAWSPRASGSDAIAQRILSDVPWTGTGAGTFEFLLPIYRAADETEVSAAPTAAASILIEMGRPMLLVVMSMTVLGIGMLIQGTLRRGRDSFYPAAGAGCLVALLILAFGNTGVLGPATSSLAGAILGLAIAQSRSWTNRSQATSGRKPHIQLDSAEGLTHLDNRSFLRYQR
jgi:hypothetical protein